MIYLVRHTMPDVDFGTCYGWSDLDTAPTFKEELASVKSKMNDVSNFKFYSSPLKRCAKLAKELAGDNHIEFDDRLKELNFGNWEDTPWEDIPKDEIEEWGNDFVNVKIPGGERYTDLLERVGDFWKNIDINDDVVIVAHDGVIRSILYQLLEMKKDNIFRINLDYGAVIRIEPWIGKHCKIFFV